MGLDAADPPDLAPYDEKGPIQLRRSNETEAIAIAGRGEPIVGLRFENVDFTRVRPREGNVLKIIDCAVHESNFAGADLKSARLLYTAFTDCDFSGSSLEQAIATSSVVRGGRLNGVNAMGASFSGTRFAGLSMRDADFSWCSFASTEWLRVHATRTNFDESLFDLSDMRDIQFTDSSLRRALFLGARIDARFTKTNLELSIFSSSDIHGSDFRGAHLQGASFLQALDVPFAKFDDDAAEHAQFNVASTGRT
jgi:uncharacterized protein YjbI with pentapeptide repeats